MYSAVRSASEMEGSKEKAGNGGWRRGRRIERKRVKRKERNGDRGRREGERDGDSGAGRGERRMDGELRKRSIGKRKSREERKMEKMAGKGEKVSRSAEEASSRSWSYL